MPSRAQTFSGVRSCVFEATTQPFLHCSWHVFFCFFFNLLVLFMFTGGLQNKQFFATIPRVEMITSWIFFPKPQELGLRSVFFKELFPPDGEMASMSSCCPALLSGPLGVLDFQLDPGFHVRGQEGNHRCPFLLFW